MSVKDPSSAPGAASGMDVGRSTSPVAGGATEASLEQLRDILFGEQSKRAEQRFQRIEEHLNRDLTSLRQEMESRLEALEQRLSQEAETLERKILEEEREGVVARERLAREVEEARRLLEDKIEALVQRTEKNFEFVKEQNEERSRELKTAVERRQEDAEQAVQRALDEVRKEKADRESLAAILSDAAQRLAEGAKRVRES